MTRFLLLFSTLLAGCAAPRPAAPPAPHASGAPAAPGVAPFAVTVTGHGPPIVFIPGLSSPGSVWDRAVAHLAPRYTCHVLTLAGFAGQPAMLGEPFLPRERDAILAYVRAQHLERPVIVGHSLGGFLAYAIAAEAPAEIGGVVAIDGLPFLPALTNPETTAAEIEPLAAQIRATLAGQDRATFAHQTDEALAGMITSPDDVARVARDADRSDPRTVGQAVYDLMTTDLRPCLAAIPAPVWLVEAGDFATAAYAAQLVRAPDHRMIVAKTARHFVMLDDPALVDTTLDAFLAATHVVTTHGASRIWPRRSGGGGSGGPSAANNGRGGAPPSDARAQQ
jgi:pimeloyl-ACP methyl ester carboxylesterase